MQDVHGVSVSASSLLRAKYLHAARELCHDHPFEVLLYASRHGYSEMADASASYGVAMSPVQSFSKLLIHLPTYVAYVCGIIFIISPVVS